MTFLSYAQNFEDVMLWRALKHIPQGFYIDVGAWSPDADSVTRAFYERGWHGINIEPNAQLQLEFAKQRPRDTNLCMAVGEDDGTATLHVLHNTGLSTLNADVARQHQVQGRPLDVLEAVTVITLSSLWRAHVPHGQAVHFLKVDVEGFEAAVLRGNDWRSNRPWVVVVEATMPMSQRPSHHEWEPLLLQADYQFAYADGLNRFYLAKEHSALLPAFEYPPNVFDAFILCSKQQRDAQQAELANAVQALKNQVRDANQRAAAAELRCDTLLKSTSWRVTAPLRNASLLWQNKRQSARETSRRKAANLARTLGLYNVARSMRNRMLGLNKPATPDQHHEVTRQQLAPEAQALYIALQKAVRQRRKAPASPGPNTGANASAATTLGHILKKLATTHASAQQAGKRLKLAYVSPVPPQRSGIADYSAELLPQLAQHYDIDLILDQPEVAFDWIASPDCVQSPAWLIENAARYDRVLYHFGNSGSHVHMFDLLAQVPGVVVLHDFFLGDVQLHRHECSHAAHLFDQTLYHSHGYPALQERFGHYPDTSSIRTHYPLNLAVLQQALGVITHSDHPRQWAQQWYGPKLSAHWSVVPLLRAPRPMLDRASARVALGLDAQDFIVASFGVLGPNKLNQRLVEAWLSSRLAKDPHCVLVFVGENDGTDYGAQLLKTIQRSASHGRIRITGWVSADTYALYLAASDTAVQLRAYSRGETSAAALDCMNCALPTIVNANPSMAMLEPDTVHQLPEFFENSQLAQALEDLWQNRASASALGDRAQQHVHTVHAPQACAARYVQAIEHHYATTPITASDLVQHIAQSEDPVAEQTLLALTHSWSQQQYERRAVRQLWIDVSATCRNDLKTGIQRVVRALVVELIRTPPEGYRVEPVYLSDDGGRLHYRYARQWTMGALAIPGSFLQDQPAQHAQGDLLLVADYTGDLVPRAERDGVFADLKADGVTIDFVVYDLLPIQQPEVFPPSLHGFEQWLDAVGQVADGVVCISRTVADDLLAWLRHSGPQRAQALRIGWFHLGADVENSAPTRGLPADAGATLAKLAAAPSFLMVGTIEPRKCYLQTIDAFTQLWEQGVDVNLVIVGAEGWKGMQEEMRRDIPQTVRRLREHPQRGAHLFWLEGISDEYLESVYNAATCLIAASSGEGFGLPLIEAARRKLPILARDIAVFREVAGDHASYFHAETPSQLAQAVQAWLSRQAPAPQAAMDTYTWKNSATQLTQVICHGNWYAEATP